jgi:hypothetical protein
VRRGKRRYVRATKRSSRDTVANRSFRRGGLDRTYKAVGLPPPKNASEDPRSRTRTRAQGPARLKHHKEHSQGAASRLGNYSGYGAPFVDPQPGDQAVRPTGCHLGRMIRRPAWIARRAFGDIQGQGMPSIQHQMRVLSSASDAAASANRAKAGTDLAPVFFMIEARWFSTVRWLRRRSAAIFLVG